MRAPWFPAVEETARRLKASGIPAFVVGGAVRDLWLGRATRDVDLVVEGSLDAARKALPDAVPINAQTPVLLLPARGDRPRIEIGALRAGSQSLEEDLSLRDFTLNAIALDPLQNVIRDPLGGQAHLRERRLVAVDPSRVFRDDPVRVLRGVRLALDLGLSIEEETERALERDAWRVGGAAPERVRDEIFRLLRLPGPSRGLQTLRRIGALAVLLPELMRTIGVEQNRHHPDDVYRHTLRVIDAVSAEPLVRLAASLHDAAKPETKRYSQRVEDFTFLRHDLLAEAHVQRAARRFSMSRRDTAIVARLVRHHLLFPDRLANDRAIRRMLRRVGDDILPALLELRRADLASRTASGHAPPEWEELVERITETRARQQGQGIARLGISGRDVMKALGIPEGQEVGRWLRRARQRVLEHPEENERERLIAWIRRSARGEERVECTRP